jgi:hypothetical protein
LELVYRKTPVLKSAHAAAAAELAAWVRAHYDPSNMVDVSGIQQIGDPDKPDSRAQLKDVSKGWVFLWFNQKENSISKGLRLAETLVPAVPSGTALEANNAEVSRREAGSAFNKKKRAALGAPMLKKSMRNPATFELIEVGFSSTGANCYKYRAQNGFGGMNVGEAVFGNTFRTSEQEGFVDAWNRDCGGHSQTIITEGVKAMLTLVHE